MEDQRKLADAEDKQILFTAVKRGDSKLLNALLTINSNVSSKIVETALAKAKQGKAAATIIKILENYLLRLSLDHEIDDIDEGKDEKAEYVRHKLSTTEIKIMREKAEYVRHKLSTTEDGSININLDYLRDAFHIAFIASNKRINAPVPIPEGEPLFVAQRKIILQGLPKAKEKKTIIIVGAGVSGLCAGYELRRAGYKVIILEASQRVGGRVETWREPFTDPLHTEAGAMRIPDQQKLIYAYLKHFNMLEQLEHFENNNKCIYLSDYGENGTLMEYSDFNQKLIDKDEELLTSCFPNLKDSEKGKSLNELWSEAVQEMTDTWWKKFISTFLKPNKNFNASVIDAWSEITKKYDSFSVRTYLEHKKWSDAAIEMYRLGTNQVLLNTSIIEMWRDDFLSLQSKTSFMKSKTSFMKQLKNGMDTFPRAFLEQHDPKVHNDLRRCIRFGAKVTKVQMTSGEKGPKIISTYKSAAFCENQVEGDFVIFAVPYNIQRLIQTRPRFSPAKQEAIETVRYVESTIVMLQFKTRWWEKAKNLPFDGKFDLASGGGIVTDLPSRYAMIPPSTSAQFKNTDRGIIRASYTFQSDSMVMAEGKVEKSLNDFSLMFGKVVKENFEVGAVNAFSQNVYTGNSALCLFGPQQKTKLYPAIIAPDWEVKNVHRAYFAGEQASFYHGWIQGAIEAGLQAAQNISNVCQAWK